VAVSDGVEPVSKAYLAQMLIGFLLRLLNSYWWKLSVAGCVLAIAVPDSGWAAADSISEPKRKARIQPQLAEKALALGGTFIADYGGYHFFELPASAASLLPPEGVEFQEDANKILLQSGHLDTTARRTSTVAALPGKLAAARPGRRLHLVQFAGPIKPEWPEQLKEMGLQIVNYIPENTYLVYGEGSALARLRELAATAPHVSFEGPYEETHKVSPQTERLTLGNTVAAGQTFAVQLLADAEANAQTLALLDSLKQAPFERQHSILHYLNVVVSLLPSDVPQVAARPDVISVLPYAPRRKFCERQSQILAGNVKTIAVGSATNLVPSAPGYLDWLAAKGFSQEQFDSSGFIVDISDSGIDDGTTMPNHFALYPGGILGPRSRVAYNRLLGTPNVSSTLAGCDGHGTLNAHILAGFDSRTNFPFTDTEGYHYGLGVCPFVRVGSSVVFDPDYFTNPDFTNLMARAYADGARISNHSWGGDATGPYDIDAQAFDILARDAQLPGSPRPTPGNQEMIIIVAAGNDGPGLQTMSSPATAKNVIAVGAGESVQAIGGSDSSDISDSQANSANDIVAFSSRGPCKDGRRKPDLVAAGTHVSGGVYQRNSPGATGFAAPCFTADGISGGAGSKFFPPDQQFFSASSGTSHSAPAVAGGAALLRQYFINKSWPPPSPAMTKAYLMNSTRYMTGASANDTLWSDKQGMGHLNLGTAFDDAPRVLRDQVPADLFTASGQSRVFTAQIADQAKPLRVTLAWTDAPGSTVGNAYNNNLDLIVTAGNTVYKGNAFAGAVSATGGQADARNNVESVFLPAGLSGPLTVRVLAVNINSDGVPQNSHPLDQDFALVIYNANLEFRPVIEAFGATVLSESYPANGVIDPGETVTVSFRLRNTGTADTTNLTATLQSTGGVSSQGPAQPYGELAVGGAPVEQAFTFTAEGDCGGPLTATLRLQDGGRDLGTAVFPLVLGKLATVTSFSEGFDGAAALPPGWAAATSNGSGWTVTPASSDTAPNAATVLQSLRSGSAELVSSPVSITSTKARLTFRTDVDLEADDTNPALAYDGGVLEIKIGTGSFADILDAGGSFVSGGYSHTVEALSENPLAGRAVWSGKSGGFLTSQVQLPAAAAGKSVQFRWRLGTDTENFFGGTGWTIDTISILDGTYACYVPPLPPTLKNVKADPGEVSFSLQTVAGQSYTVETTDDLRLGPWTVIRTFTGNGDLMTVTDSPAGQQRFYRLRSP